MRGRTSQSIEQIIPQKVEASGKHHYQIFVAGIPSCVEKAELLAYFMKFGRIERLDLHKGSGAGKLPSSKHQVSSKHKNYCKLSTRDFATFENIMSQKEHRFMERQLFCEEFRSGNSLAKHTSDIVHRRVIVKHVPAVFGTCTIQQALEEIVGKIQSIYEYKPERPHEYFNLPRKFKSFSATFCCRKTLDLLPLVFNIKINGIDIRIEKFDHGAAKCRKMKPCKSKSSNQQVPEGSPAQQSSSPATSSQAVTRNNKKSPEERSCEETLLQSLHRLTKKDSSVDDLLENSAISKHFEMNLNIENNSNLCNIRLNLTAPLL